VQAPRVSICIPTYNHAGFLRAAIDSALMQTESDLEIIIIDDCSADETLAVAASYHDRRLRVEKNERRLGEYLSCYRFFENTRGRYLKFLHDDDILHPEAVGRLADALDRFPQAAFASSAWNHMDATGRCLRTVRLTDDAPADGALIGLREIARLTWLAKNLVGNPSAVLMRQNAFGCRVRTDYRQIGDWELWLQLLLHGPLVYLPQTLSAYRAHAETQTARQRYVALTSDELLTMSLEWRSTLARVRGEVSRFDLKRLQLLCFASALQHAFQCLFRGQVENLFENLRIVIRSLSILAAKPKVESARRLL